MTPAKIHLLTVTPMGIPLAIRNLPIPLDVAKAAAAAAA